jgi:hypothetical protein
MKKFIRNFILFISIPLILLISLDLFLRSLNTLYTEKYDGLMLLKKDIEIIFLGNSHANYSINPLYIRNFKAYNLANVNQKIYFDKRLLKKVINDGVSNLKYVFISVDYHSLYSSSQGTKIDTWSYYANGIKYKNRNYIKENVSPSIWGYTSKVSINLLKKRVLQHLQEESTTINFDVERGINLNDTLTYGFIGFSGQAKNTFNENHYKLRAKGFMVSTINNEKNEIINDLKDFIIFLKNNKIEPILFSSPTFNDYNKFLDTTTINKNKTDINGICKEFNIQYWRYNEDLRFIKRDFYNADHLNKNGAKKFSSIINSKLLDYEKTRTHNTVYN